MTEMLLGLALGWLLVLTWKVWGYRGAVIQLQRDVWSDGGLVDAVTKERNA